MRRLTAVSGLAVGAVLAVSGVTAGGAAPAVHHGIHTHPASGGLRGWHKVSSSPAVAESAIGLGRFHGVLHAVWSGEDSDGSGTLSTRGVTSHGGLPAPADQLAQWSTINRFPQVISLNGTVDVVFSGERTTNGGETYDGRAEYFFTSTDGQTWTLSDQQMTDDAPGTLGSTGTDATATGGNSVVVYSPDSPQQVSFHEGTQPLTPVTGSDPTANNAGGDVLFAGDGTDAKTGDVWTVWDSLSQDKSTVGISAQRIVGTPGSRVHAPDTGVKGNGVFNFAGANQRLDVASRAGGGLYSSYGVGWPRVTRVALWKLGSSKAILRRAGGDADLTDTAPGTHGRVWVMWHDSGSHAVHVARTNRSATALGATCTVTTPNATDDVWSLAGDGTAGPLQLFVNAGPNQQATSIYTKSVQPCLTVKVSPRHARPGHRVTVTVRDAGASVAHAHVSLLGMHRKTNRHGKVSFRVPAGAHRGGHALVVKAKGYQKVKRAVRVS
jgi:hypothetical protein